MTEHPSHTPEDGAVELVATVTFRWTYTANPSDYGGKTDPEAMAAIDAENYRNDPLMYVEGEPAVTVELVGTERVDVILTDVGYYKINVIKALRETVPFQPATALRDAARLVSSTPSVVRADVATGLAAKIRDHLEAQGATVEIRPHVAQPA
jgi:ribosomal protein L7/L12